MDAFDTDYFDFSDLDANQHFIDILKYFFTNEHNPYKYTLAKKHFEACQQSSDFTTTKRLFTIITGTNLVTTKMIMTYKTTQGPRYKIKKSFLQLVQRQSRNDKRHNRQDQQPYAILATDSTTVENDDQSSKSISDHKSRSPPVQSTPIIDNTTPVSTDVTHNNDDASIDSDITKQADDISRHLDTALTNINADNTDMHTATDYTAIIKRILKSETELLFQPLRTKETLLNTKLQEVDALQSSYQRAEESLLKKSHELQTKIEYVDTKMSEWDDTLSSIAQDQKNLRTQFDALKNQLDKTSDTDLLDNKIGQLNTQLTTIHSHTKTRLHQLKSTTKAMFKQNDDDNEIMSDRIFRLEESLAKLKRKVHSPIKTKLRFDSSSDSDSPIPDATFSSPTADIGTPRLNRKPTYPTQNTTPSHTRSVTSNRFHVKTTPDMDYLRKNLHLTCSDTNQILEFYIKLRLAIGKGGIYLKPIETITKDDTIADVQSTHITDDDIQSQSNALYTLLANEKYIPATFTMAQNCILGYSTSMDGFAALKAMLKLMHPVLNKKRPSNVPPVLSEANDIHNYEQNLRNFYLLHKLYSKTQYTELDQSKQFLVGMDDSQYTETVKRVQNQLDTTEIMKIPVPEDFTLDNIASTIINIHSEYEHDTTIIRTVRSNPHYKSRGSNNSSPYQAQQKKNFNQKFSKVQCHACKQFGHIVTHCHLLPKVLAILQFKQKNEEQCNKVLRQHTANNTVTSKRTFVQALQMAQVLPDSEDLDHYLEDDIIVQAFTDNDIDVDLVSTNE